MEKMKNYWEYGRLLLFIIIGLMNTVFIKPEEAGGWENYAGYLFLFLALADLISIIRKKFLNRK